MSTDPLTGKTALITGGNSGIGKATAAALAAKGAKVIIASRSMKRGREAVNEITSQGNAPDIDAIQLDLADMQNIRNFAAEFSIQYPKLDILINNAGMISPARKESKDGYELQFAVNHLGHFLLTALLFDAVKKSDDGRIINVTSAAQKFGKIYFDDLMLKKGYRPFKAYAQSKLANILFTYELARKTASLGININCVHPGIVATPFILNKRDKTTDRFIVKLENLVFRSPEKGAATSVYLASDNSLYGSTGLYWFDRKPRKSGRRSYNWETARRLWEISEQLVNHKFSV